MNSVIGKVTNISMIENADKIEAAEVVCGKAGKWHGVVKKGEFKSGDMAFVFLPDAKLPELPEFEFMRSSKFIVKMRRLRGCPSEVLIMPCWNTESWHEIGFSLDNILGITKYEKPIDVSQGGDILGNFPSGVPKTDEPHFQTVPQMLTALIDKAYYITEKADGSSGTAYMDGGNLRMCSRNYEMKDTPGSLLWHLARKYKLVEKLPDGIMIQFEQVGPKVQGNPMGLKEPEIRVFNLWKNHCYASYDALRNFCQWNELPMVRVVDEGYFFPAVDSTWLQKKAEGFYSNGKNREGIVIRPQTEMLIMGERLSFKVINLDYKC